MKRWTSILLSLALGVSLAACGVDGGQEGIPLLTQTDESQGRADGPGGSGGARQGAAEERGEPTYKPEDVDPAVVAAHNAFALDFFRDVAGREEDEPNVFLSPLSAVLALAMTMNGAEGETLGAMKQALRMDGIDDDTILASHRALTDILAHSEGVRIDIANSLWPDEGLVFLAPFITANQEYYDAELTPVDLQSAEVVERVNKWVSERTEGKIGKLLNEPLKPEAILLLLNAIYFDANWSSPFPEDRTTTMPFIREDGSAVDASMMFRGGKAMYQDGDGFEAVRLPYRGHDLSMIVVVPDKGAKLSEFIDGLTPQKWEKMMNSFMEASGELGMPKFTIEYETQLNRTLSALGMGPAFNEETADFSRMIENAIELGVHISSVKQKTYVDVAEQGTVAAAVTSVEAATASAPAHVFDLRVDRPFLFAIHDRRTDSILFMGAVGDPTASAK